MAFNYNKLRGRIVEIFNTQSNFASAMGWSERILALKMNGMCSWKQIDICKAIQLLKLTIEDHSDCMYSGRSLLCTYRIRAYERRVNESRSTNCLNLYKQ